MNAAAPERVLALLDEASAAVAVLDISTALAQLMHRRLQLVYVESAAALVAAGLSSARVLAQATARWAPLAPPDVERAWRRHALRLRAMAEQASLPRAVPWSLQVTRGALHDTALALLPEADLLLVGGAAAAFALDRGAAPRRVVAVVDDGGPAGEEALRIAGRLCAVLGAKLQVHRIDRARPMPRLPAAVDLLVLPNTLLAGDTLRSASRSPTLLVGRDAGAQHGR